MRGKHKVFYVNLFGIVACSIVIINIVSIIIVSKLIVSISISISFSIIISSLPCHVIWENPWYPECLICMGKLMAWVNPWMSSWENPWGQKVQFLTMVGGAAETVHKYLTLYFGGSLTIFVESNWTNMLVCWERWLN